ncbi:tRNA (adenine(22)-N(1))-methyltransferase [Furfurilactobacillus sp. WILCCON 0119]
MDADHLSKRLTKVAEYVPHGARMADIGSDHAYLPAYLAKAGLIQFAVAGEVVKGPFENARSEVQSQGLTDQIEARLGDGLSVINPTDNLDAIVIAGMGGTLISDILTRGWQQLTGKERLVLQPNVGEYHLRQWLVEHQYELVTEAIMKDDGHIYEVLVAEKAAAPVMLTELDARFGPFLRQAPNAAFIEKWRHEQQRTERVLASVSHAAVVPAEKQRALQRELDLIKEVLSDASTNLN